MEYKGGKSLSQPQYFGTIERLVKELNKNSVL